MKRLIILLVMIFIPYMVLAEECDNSKITITSIEQSDIEGDTQVIDEPSINGKSIGMNLKMYEVGDSVTYDLTIKNDSDEDYMIDEDTFKSDSDYIEYVLSTEDNSNVVKANSSKNMTLIVRYKNEVDSTLLTNNKYDASNKLNFSMNTAEKPKEIEEIATEPVAPEPVVTEQLVSETKNIKATNENVENPITSSVGFKLLIVVLLTSTLIFLLTLLHKKQFTKYIVLIGMFSIIPTIYAVCKCEIEVEASIEIEKRPRLYDTIASLANEENACVIKYDGNVTDKVGETVTATNVYFDRCADKRNIIFNNMCWQVIRTKETTGTKLIYNGEVVEGKCESTRGDHKGIVQPDNGVSQAIDSSYLYGDSFAYDIANNTFTLTDVTRATWSDSTYENLIGKFTCKSNDDVCTTIYEINSYDSNTNAYLSYYTIDDTNYAQIGTSSFNANKNSPAMVGYMFNKVYNHQGNSIPMLGELMGNDVSYANGKYTLLPADGESTLGTTRDSKHHYSCNNTTGTCENVRYYYFSNNAFSYYLELSGGEKIDQVIDEMLYDDNVNKYNSSIKGIIDAWYAKELSSKTNMLEDTVYCNARNMINKSENGFNKDGNIRTIMQFKNYNYTADLTCLNDIDQFAVSNNKAKLTYPVALVTREELVTLTNNNSYLLVSALTNTNDFWWEFSPSFFERSEAGAHVILTDGGIDYYGGYVYGNSGVRPVISLALGTMLYGGTGSETDPWIVE